MNSLVGIGSKRQVDGLDVETVEISSERCIGVKDSKYPSGLMAGSKATVLDGILVIFVGRARLIFSLIRTILSVKKLMKLLLHKQLN